MVSKDLQKKYMQLQLLKKQLESLIEQKTELDQRVSELADTVNSIRKLGEIKKGEEIWSSFGGNTFIRSDIKDVDKVLIGVGAGVLLKKKRTEAAELLKLRLDELNSIDRELTEEIGKYIEQINIIEPEVQRLAEKEQ